MRTKVAIFDSEIKHTLCTGLCDEHFSHVTIFGVWEQEPCWISIWDGNQVRCWGPSKRHFCQFWFYSVQKFFGKEKLKCDKFINDICKVKTIPHLPHGTGEIKRVNTSHIFPSIPLKQIYNYNTAHQLYRRTASNTSLWCYTSGGKNPANACFHSSIGFLLRKIIIALYKH